MNVKWIGAIAVIISAAIGFGAGVIGERFATERAIYIERLDNINSLRSETYLDFFTASAKHAQAKQYESEPYKDLIKDRPENDELSAKLEATLWEYQVETKKARIRIAAFAPTEVVEALADYYRERYPKLQTCSTFWKNDVRTYLAMRKELLAGIESEDVDQEKMYMLMFNCVPPVSKGEEHEVPR